jgi:hypothetical protein
VLQGVWSGVVGTEFRIEVTKDSDANGVAHAVIVLEHVVAAGSVAVRCVVRAKVWWRQRKPRFLVSLGMTN